MKKLKYLVFLFVCLIPFFKVNAASADISVTTNKSRVIVGENVTATIKITSATAFTAWQFDVYHSSNLALVNGGSLHVTDISMDGTKSKTYTLTFKAKSSGTAKIWVDDSIISSAYVNESFSVKNGSRSLTLMTQSELEATYSKNNYLSSLSVVDQELNPKFDKDTLEYNIELENGTENIEIKATKEDSTSSIKGTGVISLKEGNNLIEVVVTAQNGSTRTYKINANVKELNPIEVNVGEQKLNVVRKKELMPQASIYYVEGTTTIDGEEVPSYYNELTSITLVGLSDIMGESKLYIYDNGTYTLYEELVFNQLYIKPMTPDSSIIPEGYTNSKIEINGKSVLVYSKEDSDFYLLYGMNLETGEKNLYKYDKVENTLQRYENIENDTELFYYIIIGLFCFIILSYLIFIILIIKNNKKTKEIENTIKIDIDKINYKKKHEKEKNED